MRAVPAGEARPGYAFAVSERRHDNAWVIGRPVDLAWPKRGWGTPFSGFRFAIPEMMGFTGRAVYMDVDMLVLGDVAELATMPLVRPWTAWHPYITDVSVIDCSAFAPDKLRCWPSIQDMRCSGRIVREYCTMMLREGVSGPGLPWSWNCRDSDCAAAGYKIPDGVKLLHFTSVPHQPWRPYGTVAYAEHPIAEWVQAWNAEKALVDAGAVS